VSTDKQLIDGGTNSTALAPSAIEFMLGFSGGEKNNINNGKLLI